MKNMKDQKFIVGLDIGNSKVVAVVGQPFPDGTIEIVGVGSKPSKGMIKGGVTDLEAVRNAIQGAIDSAADTAHCQIESVVIGIAGEHIHSLNERGVEAIGGDREVNQHDIRQAKTIAESVKMGDGLTLLQTIFQEYALDERTNITDPIGLQCMRLTVQAHLVACNQGWLADLKKAVGRCTSKIGMPLQVDGVFFSGYASAEAVLTEEEKELGVCVIDFGAGTMDIAIYTQGHLRLSKSIAYAGNRVTDDITAYFSTPFHYAEEIKIQYGSAVTPPSTRPNIEIQVKSAAPDKTITCTKNDLAKIIAPRYVELLELVKNEINELKKELEKNNIDSKLIAGMVLTGGGALIQDINPCAESVFKCPVRVGYPLNISGLTDYVDKPSYATAIGLLRCCQNSTLNMAPKEEKWHEKAWFRLKKLWNNIRAEF